MINLDGTQTVKDVCEWMTMPESTRVRIHRENGRDIYCYLENARQRLIVYRMCIFYYNEYLVVHLYTD